MKLDFFQRKFALFVCFQPKVCGSQSELLEHLEMSLSLRYCFVGKTRISLIFNQRWKMVTSAQQDTQQLSLLTFDFPVMMIIRGRCFGPVRHTCSLSLLQSHRLPPPPACRHPPHSGGSDRSGHQISRYWQSLTNTSKLGSLYCVVGVAVERYFTVCRPFQQKAGTFYQVVWTNVFQSVLSGLALHNYCCCFLLCL